VRKVSYFIVSQMEEEPFNPDYVEVDRVLDVSIGVDQHSGEVRTEWRFLWFIIVHRDYTSLAVFIQ
jgi:hypothetical protein